MIIWILFALLSGVLEANHFFRSNHVYLIDPHQVLTGIRITFAYILCLIMGADWIQLSLILGGCSLVLLGIVTKSRPLSMSFFLIGGAVTMFSIFDLDSWKLATFLLSLVLVFPLFHDGAFYGRRFYLRYGQWMPELGFKAYWLEFWNGNSTTSTSALSGLGLLSPIFRFTWLILGVFIWIIYNAL